MPLSQSSLLRARIHQAFILVWLSAAPVLGQSATEPQLPPPRFSNAVQLLNNGEFSHALAALQRTLTDEPDEPIEARLLRAQILNNAGRIEESEALWSSLADEEPVLRSFALSRLVDSTVTRGAAGLADDYLTALTNGRPARSNLDLLVAVGDILREARRPSRAETRYQEALRLARTGPVADRARLGLATIYKEAGDIDRALLLYRNTQLQFRSAAVFVEARGAARRLTGAQGMPTFDRNQYRDLVRRLRRTARYRIALELLDEWAESGTAELDQIDLERIETLYAMRSNDEAIKACAAFSRNYPSHGQLPRVHLIRFRLAVRLGRTDEVRALGGNLWTGTVPGTTLSIKRDTGILLAAYLVAVGLVDEGLDVYRELFRITQNAGDQRTVLWRAGIAALQSGQLERAETNLRGLVRRRPTGELAPAALYWLGIVEQRLGRVATAVDTFRSLTTRYPYHYYGVRGLERLRDETLAGSSGDGSSPRSRLSFPELKLTRATVDAPELQAATLLARAGLSLDAADTAWALLQQRSHDRGLAFLTAMALATAGDYARASRVVTNHFGEFLLRPAGNLPKNFWQLVYPRPFRSDVEAAAEANGMDPLMLYAIMRQESRFDPSARSAVGALGLFQIMPATAAAIGPLVGVGNVSNDESAMIEPSVNAAIGAALASRLLTMFDGHLAPVAASYNAGEDLARVWWTAVDGLREDYFVDAIPYSETRRFVREVLTNHASYRRLYANSTP